MIVMPKLGLLIQVFNILERAHSVRYEKKQSRLVPELAQAKERIPQETTIDEVRIDRRGLVPLAGFNGCLTPSPANRCRNAIFRPRWQRPSPKGARAVSYAIENILTFSCVSAFFAGVVVAAAGLMI